MKKYNLAIVGATGLVGRTFLKVLKERNFPIKKLYLYASSRSKGIKIQFDDKEYEILELTENNIQKDIDIALFSAGGEISLKYAPLFSKNNTVVIDNSSAWRMYENIPLIVPEVNGNVLTKEDKIIANPNCSTIQVVPVLNILNKYFKIKRIIYSTYQAISGAGQKAIDDYNNNMNGISSKYLQYDIFNNLIPQIDVFLENGYTKEEMKMINETNKILNENIPITATCVRVPVLNSHSISVNVELEKEFDIDEIISKLKEQDNIIIQNNNSKNIYPMPLISNNTDEIYVGRIRKDFSKKNTLNLFIVADNIRKGAATNTIQIAEYIIKKGII